MHALNGFCPENISPDAESLKFAHRVYTVYSLGELFSIFIITITSCNTKHWLCSQRMNHVPNDISDRDPLRDWDRDLNYVRSQVALQLPSQSRSGSAHCEVIFCSHCAVHADWHMHAWLQRAFPKACTRTNHVPKELCVHNVLESGFLRGSRSKTPPFSRFKTRFKSLIWKSFAFTKGKIRLSK